LGRASRRNTGSRVNMKRRQQVAWLDGAYPEWRKIDALYARIVTASERGASGERRRLRRLLFYTIHRAIEKARYRGRIVRALGDATLKPEQRVKTLLRSYSISKKEGDFYNCLLTADSLAHFFVECRHHAKRARQWIAETKRLLRRFRDADIRKNMLALSRRVGDLSKN
jgi:hypothetical protein